VAGPDLAAICPARSDVHLGAAPARSERCNDKNLFTGWVDSDLNAAGEEEARAAGRVLAEAEVLPEVAHTSVRKRAIRTCNLTLDECDRAWIPVRRHWRLNERHYGALQGLDKAETQRRHGEEQFMAWRRSYDVPPPPLEPGSQWDVSDDPATPTCRRRCCRAPSA
jgi:2,3-bisphosphoglycerate-dependent phosphoglycerate mutase